jgi:Flp pilus assembly protein TadB
MTRPHQEIEVRADTHTRVDVDPVSGRPHEHHEDPDEIPHDVIGVLALSLAMIAIFVALLWLTLGPVAAAIGGLIAATIAIVRLSRRAARERLEEHPPPPDVIQHAPPQVPPGPARDDERPEQRL